MLKLRPLPTLRIQQPPSKAMSRLKAEAARLGLYGGAVLLAGWVAAQPAIDSALDRVQRQAQADALSQFEDGWKDRLSSNQPLMRSACTAWWFGMNSTQRRVK
jgi:hypothetical protein